MTKPNPHATRDGSVQELEVALRQVEMLKQELAQSLKLRAQASDESPSEPTSRSEVAAVEDVNRRYAQAMQRVAELKRARTLERGQATKQKRSKTKRKRAAEQPSTGALDSYDAPPARVLRQQQDESYEQHVEARERQQQEEREREEMATAAAVHQEQQEEAEELKRLQSRAMAQAQERERALAAERTARKQENARQRQTTSLNRKKQERAQTKRRRDELLRRKDETDARDRMNGFAAWAGWPARAIDWIASLWTTK